MSAYKFFLRPLLFRLDPENSHDRILQVIPILAPLMKAFGQRDAALNVKIAGLSFPSPVGLAAGFDKDLRCFKHMFSFGFGAVEVGTVTPEPQSGNPMKRIERLAKHNAVVNRMGFPNIGLARALRRLKVARRAPGPIGVNLGANKDSPDRIQDYLTGYRAVARYCDYVTINVSSPNTPGLRALESGEGLRSLLDALDGEIDVGGTPVFLKVSPDLSEVEIDQTCKLVLASKISAVIVGNTTTQRPDAIEANYESVGEGGLSGEPLRAISFAALRRFRDRLGGKVPLISVGGIVSAEDVIERIEAGASLVQIYTGFIYEGPMLVHRINAKLSMILKERGHLNLQQAIGAALSPKTVIRASSPNSLRIAEPALVA